MTLRPVLLCLPALVAMSVWTAAGAVPVIVNGGFEQTSLTASTQMNASNVTGWSTAGWTGNGATAGYNFLFFPGTATTTGSYTPQFNGSLVLGGTLPSGASNNFPASSPNGGNFVGADGAYEVAAIQQTISGLIPNTQYALSFYWAGAQQQSYTGSTTEQWQVTLGSELHSTPVITNPQQGFTGWFAQTFLYTATSTSEVLSFLAAGTPNGAPPFVLLDGVSITAVAEPASWMTLVAAVLSIIGVAHLKRRSSQRARLAAANGGTQPAGRAGHAKPRRRRRSYAHGAAC